MKLEWIAQEAKLTAAALTVRAQAISPNDTGRLLWDLFFPRRDVDSVKINEITTLDVRMVSDRREWNSRGRLIPLVTPSTAVLEMIPVESYFSIGEREIQELTERTFGNEDTFRQVIGARIPERVDALASANYRRLEVDAMQAWSLGHVVVRNPQSNAQYTASFSFDSSRYQTAGTAWDDSGLNAYDEFIKWCEDAIDAIGSLSGVMIRLATFKAIQADAPQGVNSIPLSRSQLRDQVQQDLGRAFQFYIREDSFDLFNDGGIDYTRTKVWPDHVIAAVPDGVSVGNMAFAPVARAYELATSYPNAGIDVRGMSVFQETSSNGRKFDVEAQVNALPVPNEQKMFVINVGV